MDKKVFLVVHTESSNTLAYYERTSQSDTLASFTGAVGEEDWPCHGTNPSPSRQAYRRRHLDLPHIGGVGQRASAHRPKDVWVEMLAAAGLHHDE